MKSIAVPHTTATARGALGERVASQVPANHVMCTPRGGDSGGILTPGSERLDEGARIARRLGHEQDSMAERRLSVERGFVRCRGTGERRRGAGERPTQVRWRRVR